MKYCSNCGEEIKNNSKFCSNCGTKINNGSENDFLIKGDVNLNITNKTTEKIIDDVSRNVKNTTNKTVGLFKKILPFAVVILVIWIIVGIVNEKQRHDEIARQNVIDAEFNNIRKRSDEKYWNNGNGIYFESRDYDYLKVAIETIYSDHIYVTDEIYYRADGFREDKIVDAFTSLAEIAKKDEKVDKREIVDYGNIVNGSFKIYYDKREDGSYDIVQIDVAGSNQVKTYYNNSLIK